MLNLNFFKQKSPQQRFLFILGLAMMLLYIVMGLVIIFYFEKLNLNLNPDRFPSAYRIIFGVILIVYAIIRFFRVIAKK